MLYFLVNYNLWAIMRECPVKAQLHKYIVTFTLYLIRVKLVKVENGGRKRERKIYNFFIFGRSEN